MSAPTVDELCEVMHDAYEKAAIGTGWETNPASRKPWSSVPEANKETMRAAVRALLEHLGVPSELHADEDGAPYPEVFAVYDPNHDPILYLPYPGATGTGSKETAERIVSYNRHLGLKAVRCQLVPLDAGFLQIPHELPPGLGAAIDKAYADGLIFSESSRSTRSVGHPVFTHSDGVTCVEDENGVWFTPYDTGGEGPNCDRSHELRPLPAEPIAAQCIDWPLCGHGTEGCSP